MTRIGDPTLELRMARAMIAGTRGVALLTVEDDRALSLAEALADRLAWPLHTWSVAAGVDRGGRERELGALLARLQASDDEALWLLFEAGRELRGSAQRRMLRELVQATRGPTLVLVESDRAALPDVPELEVEQLALPDVDLLGERVRWIAAEIAADRPLVGEALREAAELTAIAGVGLTLDRFDRAVAEALLADTATPATIAAALSQRRLTDACASRLEIVETSPSDALIGFDRYLSWLRLRAASSTRAARRAGLERARGVGLLGLAGCGRRLAARVGASTLGLPLVRVRADGPLTPEALRATKAALERAAPIALILDELDAPEHVDELGRWLATGDRGVFTFAIASSPERLPVSEALDELFFVELPDAEARAALLSSLLARSPALDEPPDRFVELARAATDCSTGDLADALARARLQAFARARPLTSGEFEAALAERPPLGVRESARLDALRSFAKLRCRNVN